MTLKGIKSIEKTKEYKKLFVKKQNSLLTGTSRAERLNTDLINGHFQSNSAPYNVYNYAFNLGMSPYGPDYVNSIINHINFESKEKGVFILCIDPWALSEKTNKKNAFPESSTQINFNNEQQFATLKYFFKTYSKPYYNLFLPTKSITENEIKKRPNKEFIKRHSLSKIASYEREHLNSEEVSNRRISSLIRLINKLKTKGKIYLVKLPVSMEMILLERKYSIDFDERIKNLVDKHQLNLIDFYDYADKFLCLDGNHLWKEDANNVSLIIADIISLDEKRLLIKDKMNLIEPYIEFQEAKYRHLLN